MKLSIIMSVLNVESEPAFPYCMDGLLKQTWSNFECIICDDGSTDKTYFKLEEYAKQDSRIILIKNNTNMGLAYSLNRCMKLSRGDIIVRQDIDDISALHRLETLVAYHMKYPNIYIISSNVLYYNDAGITKEVLYPEFPTKEDFLFTIPFKHGAVSFKRNIMSDVGLYLVKKRTRRCEDYEFLMRCYQKNITGYTIQESLYFYFEDHTTIAKRKFKYRIDEFWVRLIGFYQLKLYPKGIFYTIKPLIVGCIPYHLLSKLKNLYYTKSGGINGKYKT